MSNPKITDFDFKNLEALRRYEINAKTGAVKTDGTAEDHARAMEALRAIERLGPIDAEDRPLKADTASHRASASFKSLPVSEAAQMWLVERAKKNGPRTVDAKRYHVADFMRRLASDLPVNRIDKAMVLIYKNAMLGEKKTGKTIDNKLMSLHDFFSFMLANGLYTVDNANPVSGLFILDKKAREVKTESYDEFTRDEIKKLFDPAKYLPAMSAPDTFWPPLLALYTGMRISEATAIKAADVLLYKGVHYIKIPKSKTTAGIRNVPICDALLGLGFLDYVAEVKAANAVRLFPHCLHINGSYSKDLSAAMLAHQTALGIKDDRKSFHSFRVGVITDLSNKSANTAQIMKIVGHKAREGNEVHLGYVRELPDLKAVVDLMDWPLDLPALAYDGRFGKFVADPANWAKEKTAQELEDIADKKNAKLKAGTLGGIKAKTKKGSK